MRDQKTDGDRPTPDEGCGCCGDDGYATERAEETGRDGGSGAGTGNGTATETRESFVDRSELRLLEAELPGELRQALGRLLGIGSVDTLGEWTAACRRRVGGGSITFDDLCHARSTTPHRAALEGETYHFRCFYDAVALAAIVDAPVVVRTESPDGTVIEARAVGTEELTGRPDGAVFSFGVAADPPTDGDPTREDVYAAVCPYVKAFPSRDAYERWATTVTAPTVATPLAGATDLAAALVA